MRNESQSLVSVITPVYNGAKHLAECIDSVLAQTYQHWIYTIVNNCSTDETLEIAQAYATRDPRIRIHNNQTFLPVIENHNHALRQVSSEGKYCKLLFADDWLFSECLQQMVQLAEAHPSVGLVSSYGLRDSTVLWTGLQYPSTVISGRETCRQRLQDGPYVFGTGTSQMFRADLVRSRDPFYNDRNLHCDSEVCFQILQASDFGFIHQILHYTRAPGAESYTTFAFKRRSLEAMKLYEVLTYGQVFLTQQEFDFYREKNLAEYYDFLAQCILAGGESWKFHKSKLNEFGLSLDRTRLAAAVAKKGLRALFKHPKQTFVQLVHGTSILRNRLRSE